MGHANTAGHGDHGHPAHLQHHFDSSEQQFDSGKLGMWLFLATEILLFGGLFVAYAVYRANHPEIFIYAHTFLDTKLGAINTVVLLCSSLTMAWSVRASQLGQQKLLVILLSLTILGGFGFLGIKFVEYKAKWEHGLLWAAAYHPTHDSGHGEADSHGEDSHAADTHDGAGAAADAGAAGQEVAADGARAAADLVASAEPVPAGEFRAEKSALPGPGIEPIAMALPAAAGDHGGDHGTTEPERVQIFFSIYFLMTGLHGLHVIIGMLAIGWVLVKAMRGVFSPAYFTPVDLVGLYWHLVDLIWIFLFPLLYLIH